ncbi:glycosyltransferase [Erysipelotrichaceae bacterium HCN-30851]
MKKILYVSNCAPYSSVKHAGGKTFNYYINSLSKCRKYDIRCISFCKEEEMNDINRDMPENINMISIVTKGGIILNLKRILFDFIGILFNKPKCEGSYYKFNKIYKELLLLKKQSFFPDIIVLEWTNIVLLAEYISFLFPKARLIASEHDVSFLGIERKISTSKLFKNYKKKKLEQYKRLEILSLDKCIAILVQNEKDKNLLKASGINANKIFEISPYFHNMSYIERKKTNNNILFWGAMYRAENYEAAIWFIKNVMPLIKEEDCKFIVAGNKPPKKLKKLASDKVIITGFIDDESPFFEQSLCFVSPLLTGAGVKVKVIEALSAGIPILTNKIGIEGIPAEDNISYFHCEKPDEYAECINKLILGKYDIDALSENQKSLVSRHYNLEKSEIIYRRVIENDFD